MNKYALGIDLGISSVGFGIVDKETLGIVDYGVRLFEESSADNNKTRRGKRSQRRQKRRKSNRILEMRRLINQYIISKDSIIPLENIYDLRIKGLRQKLDANELANVLINLAKKRGSSLDVVIDENDKDNLSLAQNLTANTKELVSKNMYICELQKERLEKLGFVKGHNNIFRTDDYIRELNQILSNQQLGVEVNNKIVQIISRRRDYSEGPGDINSPTPYGRFKGEYDELGNKIIHNLINDMRGTCSIYPQEFRMAKNTYSACLFNLLNDLNNLSIIDDGIKRKITKEEKQLIISEVREKGNITVKKVLKLLCLEEDKVSGFRVNKSGESVISSFEVYYKIIKIFNKNNENEMPSENFVDEVVEILTKTQVEKERYESIDEIVSLENIAISDESLKEICKLTKVNGYHSLSKKAILELNKEMLEEPLNQQQIITIKSMVASKSYKGKKEIVFDDSLILSPVAKRAHREAIKVINELRKEYGEFETIMIETTRSKNSNEEREEIKKEQERFEQANKDAVSLAQENNLSADKLNGIKRLKLKLYKEQNGKCIYSGNPINLQVLLTDDTAYQIEHIIPYAVSFDNSYNNKSLAEVKANRLKGKNTPFYYYQSGNAYGNILSFEAFKKFVETLSISQKKKENLLNMEDLSKYNNMESFVNRNLNDTSYAVVSMMNTIKKFFNDNDIKTVVRTVKGKQTHTFRSLGRIDDGAKNRDYYIHHAIDALIIAGLSTNKCLDAAYKTLPTINSETGEVLDDPFEDSSIRKFLKELSHINHNINLKTNPFRFSYKIDTKLCRQISDETIYSTRNIDGKDMVVKKYKDIYGKDGESLTNFFKNGKSSQLLMYRNDINTYNILKNIYEEYKNATDNGKPVKNVFQYYTQITKQKIRKYSKKGNGPIIVSVKYLDGILGNNIDISKNYNCNNKKVVLLQTSSYRTDIYKNKDGLYKFVTVRRYHVKSLGKKYVIDYDDYNNLKTQKGINDSFEFQFSLNRNSIVFIKGKEEGNYYRFVATNNDKKNVIELKLISTVTKDFEKNKTKQLMYTIGRSTQLIEKYNVSITGKWNKVEKEDLKLEY